MAVVSGTVHSVRTMESGAWDPKFQLCEILFTVAGVYAQADNAELAALPALIQNSRRNGMTPTIRAVMAGRPAYRNDNATPLTLGSVALSGAGAAAKATFAVNAADWTTELADGAVPEQARPFSILVAFTEA